MREQSRTSIGKLSAWNNGVIMLRDAECHQTSEQSGVSCERTRNLNFPDWRFKVRVIFETLSAFTLREEVTLHRIQRNAMKNAAIMKQMEFVVEQDAKSHRKQNIIEYTRRQLVICVTYKRAKQQFPLFLFFNFLRSTQLGRSCRKWSPSET